MVVAHWELRSSGKGGAARNENRDRWRAFEDPGPYGGAGSGERDLAGTIGESGAGAGVLL